MTSKSKLYKNVHVQESTNYLRGQLLNTIFSISLMIRICGVFFVWLPEKPNKQKNKKIILKCTSLSLMQKLVIRYSWRDVLKLKVSIIWKNCVRSVRVLFQESQLPKIIHLLFFGQIEWAAFKTDHSGFPPKDKERTKDSLRLDLGMRTFCSGYPGENCWGPSTSPSAICWWRGGQLEGTLSSVTKSLTREHWNLGLVEQTMMSVNAHWTNIGTARHWAFVLFCLPHLISLSGQQKLINFPSYVFYHCHKDTFRGGGFTDSTFKMSSAI